MKLINYHQNHQKYQINLINDKFNLSLSVSDGFSRELRVSLCATSQDKQIQCQYVMVSTLGWLAVQLPVAQAPDCNPAIEPLTV